MHREMIKKKEGKFTAALQLDLLEVAQAEKIAHE